MQPFFVSHSLHELTQINSCFLSVFICEICEQPIVSKANNQICFDPSNLRHQ
jgi:hypothetical protein